MKKVTVRDLTTGALIAAAYAAFTLLCSAWGIGFGPVQFRLSEALCLLPLLYPSACGGLFVGCLLANLLSPYGLLDLLVGSLSTLLAALWTRKMPNAWLGALPPVLCNAVLVGAVIAYEQTGFSAAFASLWAYNGLTVGLGEAAVCFGLGAPLLKLLQRRVAGRNRAGQ